MKAFMKNEIRLQPCWNFVFLTRWLSFGLSTGETKTWYTYFVRNKKYWRFDESRGKVDKGYPRSFSEDWMGCINPENLVGTSDEEDEPVIEPPKTDAVVSPGSHSPRAVSCGVHISLLVLLSWCVIGWRQWPLKKNKKKTLVHESYVNMCVNAY